MKATVELHLDADALVAVLAELISAATLKGRDDLRPGSERARLLAEVRGVAERPGDFLDVVADGRGFRAVPSRRLLRLMSDLMGVRDAG